MTITHSEFVKRISQISPSIEIIGTYTKATEPIKVKCRTCGQEWEPKAYSLSSGKGCPHCSAIKGAKNNNGKTALKTTEEFESQLSLIDDSIKIDGVYVNGHTNIRCICKRCRHVWEAKPYSLLQGHGCPRCAKSGTSFMEQFILQSFKLALGDEQVLSRDKSAIGMELDIYVPSKRFAVEPGNWFLHCKNFKRDKLKRDKCSQQGITLYTVYDVYPANAKVPFESNCITYNFDLNRADHKIIQELVCKLLGYIKVDKQFTNEELKFIEEKAYENAKGLTHEDFIEKIRQIHPNIEVLGTYRNANSRIKVKCNTCGLEWEAVPANLLSGDGCRRCGAKKAHHEFLKSQNEFIKEISKKNPTIEIMGEYTGRHNPIKARCKICGYVWSPRASSLLRGSTHKGAVSIHKNLKNQSE